MSGASPVVSNWFLKVRLPFSWRSSTVRNAIHIRACNRYAQIAVMCSDVRVWETADDHIALLSAATLAT
jgi:hypothetical protein